MSRPTLSHARGPHSGQGPLALTPALREAASTEEEKAGPWPYADGPRVPLKGGSPEWMSLCCQQG